MFNATIFVTFITIFTAFLGFVNQALLAKMFGTSPIMDAFLAGTSIPMFVSGAIGAAMSFTVTPHLINNKIQNSDYKSYGGMLHLALLIPGLIILLGGYVSSPVILSVLLPSSTTTVMNSAITIARITWVTGFLSITTIYLTCALNAANKFIFPATVSTLPYIGMSIFVLFFGRQFGPAAISIGLLIGTLSSLVLLYYFSSNFIHVVKWIPSKIPAIMDYIQHLPLIMLAMLCFTIYQSIDSFWGPRLGVGNLATLGYAQRILIAVGNLIIAGPSAVLMPKFAKAHHELEPEVFLGLVSRVIRLVLACACFMAIVTSILSTSIIRFLFARGAFDQNSVYRLAGILPFMLTGMIAMSSVVILFRILYTQKNMISPAIIGGVCAFSYFVLSGLLSKKLGLTGIGIAYICSWSLGLLLALISVHKNHIWLITSRDNFVFIIQLFISLLVTYGILKVVLIWGGAIMASSHGMALLAWIGLHYAVAIAAFWLLVTFVFGIPEFLLLNEQAMNVVKPKIRPIARDASS